jgi:hypothetical protein
MSKEDKLPRTNLIGVKKNIPVKHFSFSVQITLKGDRMAFAAGSSALLALEGIGRRAAVGNAVSC